MENTRPRTSHFRQVIGSTSAQDSFVRCPLSVVGDRARPPHPCPCYPGERAGYYGMARGPSTQELSVAWKGGESGEERAADREVECWYNERVREKAQGGAGSIL